MKKIIFSLILTSILLFSCQGQKKEEKLVRESFDSYKSAILSDKRDEAANFLDSQGDQESLGDNVLTQREQIFSQVREGNTEAALDLLERTGQEDAPLLRAQFEQVHKDFFRGLIVFDNFAITLARLNFAILEWAPGAPPKVNAEAVSKDQIRKLAEAGELEAALQLLLPAIELDATLQFARLHSTEKYYQQGQVSEEQLERVKLKIKFAILEMAE